MYGTLEFLLVVPIRLLFFGKKFQHLSFIRGLYVYQIGKISKKISIENWIYITFIRILSGLYVYDFLKNMQGYTFISCYMANRNSRVGI